MEALPGATVRVYDAQAGGVEERLLEEYLVGVVAAEMPVSFHEQALRAQAVAARTYTAYRAAHGGCGAHDGADVCTSSACCQAYATDEALRARWGADYAQNLARVEAAVYETAGEVLLYGGAPIEALYHSASGGYTEDSENVFANAVPYLRAVESPDEVGTSHLTGSVRYARAELCALVNAALPEAALSPRCAGGPGGDPGAEPQRARAAPAARRRRAHRARGARPARARLRAVHHRL